MKKYSPDCVSHGEVISEMVADNNGQWVPADVAQALYDALKYCVLSAPAGGPLWHGSDEMQAARMALSKADKE